MNKAESSVSYTEQANTASRSAASAAGDDDDDDDGVSSCRVECVYLHLLLMLRPLAPCAQLLSVSAARFIAYRCQPVDYTPPSTGRYQ